jgi:hypothetical protein
MMNCRFSSGADSAGSAEDPSDREVRRSARSRGVQDRLHHGSAMPLAASSRDLERRDGVDSDRQGARETLQHIAARASPRLRRAELGQRAIAHLLVPPSPPGGDALRRTSSANWHCRGCAGRASAAVVAVLADRVVEHLRVPTADPSTSLPASARPYGGLTAPPRSAAYTADRHRARLELVHVGAHDATTPSASARPDNAPVAEP